jgi:hypothetical protein
VCFPVLRIASPSPFSRAGACAYTSSALPAYERRCLIHRDQSLDEHLRCREGQHGSWGWLVVAVETGRVVGAATTSGGGTVSIDLSSFATGEVTIPPDPFRPRGRLHIYKSETRRGAE